MTGPMKKKRTRETVRSMVHWMFAAVGTLPVTPDRGDEDDEDDEDDDEDGEELDVESDADATCVALTCPTEVAEVVT